MREFLRIRGIACISAVMQAQFFPYIRSHRSRNDFFYKRDTTIPQTYKHIIVNRRSGQFRNKHAHTEHTNTFVNERIHDNTAKLGTHTIVSCNLHAHEHLKATGKPFQRVQRIETSDKMVDRSGYVVCYIRLLSFLLFLPLSPQSPHRSFG